MALSHLLRTYALAIQLASRRRVEDFTAGEPSRLELVGYAEAEWLAWRDKFEPRLERLHDELRAAARRDEEGWRKVRPSSWRKNLTRRDSSLAVSIAPCAVAMNFASGIRTRAVFG